MIEQASVDWEAGAPRSIFFGDIYFSGDGVAESRHVFIKGNNLAERIAPAQSFCVGELGFGTGLNVLVLCDLWRKTARSTRARLNILSFEKHPLSKHDLALAHRLWPEFADLSRAMLQAYPPPIAGAHRLRLADDILLTLVFGDAREALARIGGRVDAWFLDGFAPSKNPDVWSAELFTEVARLSAPGATAATFTVAGDVRRALSAAGFTVERRAGFGRKHEMLTARIERPRRASRRAPWFAAENLAPLPAGAEIAVIGGGIAGASLAYEMRAAGLRPTIIDPLGIPAGASGNPAGLIMPRLDLGDGATARFFRSAYVHTLRTIADIENESGERVFNRCGVLLKATTDEERVRQEKIVAARLLPNEWIEPRDEGFFFSQAGVVDPVRYCRLLASETPVLHQRAVSVAFAADRVAVAFGDGNTRSFNSVVLANGREALRFREARSLPLTGVTGQIDHFPNAAPPESAVAFGPYAAPAPGGGLAIGATYDPIEIGDEPSTSSRATRANIEAIGLQEPALAAHLYPAASRPRASVRCQTPDRAPVAGPLPDWDFYAAAYDGLRFGARRDYPAGRVIPGAFILSGLGSRGLVTAPLAAAMIVSEMTGAPMEADTAEALHPARFLIRELKRSQRRLPGAAASGLTAS